jgi:hypothetical protein
LACGVDARAAVTTHSAPTVARPVRLTGGVLGGEVDGEASLKGEILTGQAYKQWGSPWRFSGGEVGGGGYGCGVPASVSSDGRRQPKRVLLQLEGREGVRLTRENGATTHRRGGGGWAHRVMRTVAALRPENRW